MLQDSDSVIQTPPAVHQDLDTTLRLQACWIRLWDRWACEQRNLVLYQMHINHALSRERSKLTLAGGRVVSCKRINRQHHQSPSTGSVRCCSNAAIAVGVPLHPEPSPCAAPAAEAANAVVVPAVGGPDAAGVRDLRVLSSAVDRLRASGWYYEGAEAQARAADALSRMPAGRFCVRDSKHSAHLFTMDVQTGGPGTVGRLLSVRFTYSDGEFGLDTTSNRRPGGGPRVPKFRCPIELIDYYMRLSRIEAVRRMLVYHAWIDQCGQFSWMNLRRPMIKTDAAGFPSLKHTARLVINRHKRLITITPTSLPNELIEYLLQYPYSL